MTTITRFGFLSTKHTIMLISNGLQPIAVARLLGSRVRIPLRARIFVSCVCCVRSSLGDELITRYRSSTACVCVRDIVTSEMRRHRSDLACSATEKNGLYLARGGRDSSVGIATRYGLDGPGIESLLGQDFPRPSRPAMGTTQPPIKWVSGPFPGGKVAGTWRWPPTPSSDEVKERVEVYIYSPSGPSWPVLG